MLRRSSSSVAPRWFESEVLWSELGIERTWKEVRLYLRVCEMVGGFFVAPFDIDMLKQMVHYIGPYHTLEDAQLAAEMIGEIKGEEND